jgi:DNA-binding transcriptional regulator YiaG
MKLATRKIPFDVYLPATAEKEAAYAETIEIEVYENFGQEFLTPESSERIERTRARYLGFLHGSDIRSLRKRLGLTQDELSTLLDCGEKSLSRWESGRGLPSGIVNKLLRLLEEGRITPADLAAVSGPRKPSELAERFQRMRPSNIIEGVFAKHGPTKPEVDEWIAQSQPEAACQ